MYILKVLFLNRVSRWILNHLPTDIQGTDRSKLIFREMIYFMTVFFTLYIVFMIGSKLTEFTVWLLTNSDFQVSFWIFNSMFFFLGTIAMNKDIIKGQGIVNRHFGYRVVDAETEMTATPIRCMLRNVTVILFPFEFFYLQRSDRRIGDYLVGTKLVKVTPVAADTMFNDLTNFKWDKASLISILIPLTPCIALLSWVIYRNLR
jgi:uncharacterized RDD family membrane protein YckC